MDAQVKSGTVMVQADELTQVAKGFRQLWQGYRCTLPVLGHACVSVKSGGATITADNCACRLTYALRTSTDLPAGAFLVPLAALYAAAKSRGAVTLCPLPCDTVVLGQGVFASSHPAMPATEFPVDGPEIATAPAPLADLLAAYVRVLPCASPDAICHVMTGVYAERTAGGTEVVATDGRRLARVSVPGASAGTAMFPSDCRPLSGVLLDAARKAGGAMGFAPTDNANVDAVPLARILAGPWDCTLRTIVGTYPNYRQVIPTATNMELTLDTADIAVIRAAAQMWKPTDRDAPDRSLHLVFAPDGAITLSHQGENPQVLPLAARTAPADLPSFGAFNPGYFLAGLDFCGAGACRLLLTREPPQIISPVVFTAPDGGQYVLMPMRN